MSKRFLLTLLIALLLCGCAAPAPAATPAATPTDTSIPFPTPSLTATESTIPVNQLIPSDFYTAFNALENTGSAENFFTVENNKLYITVNEQKVEISPSGQFGVNVDSSGKLINNPLASLSVVGTDGNTYGFNPETQVWFNASEFQGNSDILNPEVIDINRVFDGTLTRALLLNSEINTPFPAGTLYKSNYVTMQWANYGDYAYLNDVAGADPQVTVDTIDTRMIDSFFRVVVPKGTVLSDGKITDEDYSFDFQPQKKLDPQDPNNPNLSQFKILFMTRGQERSTREQDMLYLGRMRDAHSQAIPLLTATDDVLHDGIRPDSMANEPSSEILFDIPGNNASSLPFWGSDITSRLARLSSSTSILGFDAFTPGSGLNYSIPPEMQKMLLSFYLGKWIGK